MAVGWNKSQITVCCVKIQTPTIITGKITTRKKRYSRQAVGWNKSQITICPVKIRTPTIITGKITTRKKRYSHLAVGWNKSQITVCHVKIRIPTTTTGKNYDRKKSTVICNTRNISFLLCLYLIQGYKHYVGIVWFEGKAPSRTSKTCLTMMEPFAGPSSMAMGNQPMPSRYPLCMRLSEGGVRSFLLTLWFGGDFFFSKHINFMLI